jgi:hypothetical protein
MKAGVRVNDTNTNTTKLNNKNIGMGQSGHGEDHMYYGRGGGYYGGIQPTN